MKGILNIYEFLQQLLLLSPANAILLFPARRELHVESIHFVFVLGDQVVNLDLDAVATFLEELLYFALRQSYDLLAYTFNFRITRQTLMVKPAFKALTSSV